MSIILPELEIVDRNTHSVRYLEHGWPTKLCRWHSHKEYELHLVTQSRGKAFVGDYIGEFTPGTLYLTGPNLPHNWITDDHGDQPIEVRDMLVQFGAQALDRLALAFPEFGDFRPMLQTAQSGIEFVGFNPRFAQGHLEAIRDSNGPERIVAFLRFMTRLNEHAEKKPLSVVQITQPEGNSKHARIGEVIDFIIKNFAEEISVDSAAKMAGMTPATFSRSFQSVTGHRFIEFVTQVRIGQACSMLYATDEQVSSICFGVGFQNLANFNRHFLKMKQMTPSEYRDIARNELAPAGGAL